MRNIVFLVILAFASSVSAEEWEYRLLPYLWAAGLKGEVATLPGASPAEVDASFSDIVDHLDFTVMAAFEARKDRFAIISEILYLDLTTDETDTPGPAFGKTSYSGEVTVATLAVSHRYKLNSDTSLDASVGARYWHVDNHLKLEAGLAPSRRIEDSEDWADLMLGAKIRNKLDAKWSISASVMFAVVGESDSQWDAKVATGYQSSERVRWVLGYRHLEVDYDSGGFLWDVELYGPFGGAIIKF